MLKAPRGARRGQGILLLGCEKKKDAPEEPDDNLAEVIIGKQRNGPTGTVKLVFLDDLTKFEDLEYEDGLE